MIGGLSLSMVFPLVLIPVLFTLWFDARVALARAATRAKPGRSHGRPPADGRVDA
jgi:hypothetical protein